MQNGCHTTRQRGFSLTSAMVGIALLGFAAVVLSRIFSNATLNSIAIKQMTGWSLMKHQLMMVMTNPDSCMETFSALNLSNPGGQSIQVKRSSGSVAFKINDRYDGLRITRLSAAPGSPDSDGNYLVTLVIEVEKRVSAGGRVAGRRKYSKQLYFNLYTNNAGALANCVTSKRGTMSMLPNREELFQGTYSGSFHEDDTALPSLPDDATHAIVSWSLDANIGPAGGGVCNCDNRLWLGGRPRVDDPSRTQTQELRAVGFVRVGVTDGSSDDTPEVQVNGVDFIKIDHTTGKLYWAVQGRLDPGGGASSVPAPYGSVNSKISLHLLGYTY